MKVTIDKYGDTVLEAESAEESTALTNIWCCHGKMPALFNIEDHVSLTFLTHSGAGAPEERK